MLSTEIVKMNVYPGGSLDRSRPADVCLSLCVHVRVSVCQSIFVSGVRRDGPIRKGEEDKIDKRSA